MKESLVKKVADAVLYEGYLLYPYRPSAVKNQQRWNFGALCPESYCRAQAGTESWTMQTQVLVESEVNTSLTVAVRFLHLLNREVGQVINDCKLPLNLCGHRQISTLEEVHFAVVPIFEVDGQLFQPLQEAVEREVEFPITRLDTSGKRVGFDFTFPGSEAAELLHSETSGEIVGVLLRRQEAVEGTVEVQVEGCESNSCEAGDRESNSARSSLRPTCKVTVQIRNLTPFENADERTRDESLLRSFVSTHTILTVDNGKFISLLDPGEQFRSAAASCSNVGTYPVLVGEEGARDCMLSSPIILYDYPQIAPESAGSLFDGTEIDEILTLRIMTLTDEEKRELRSGDELARRLLERTETLPADQLMKMHGVMKGVKS